MDPILITVPGPRGAPRRRSASSHADPDVVRRPRPPRAGRLAPASPGPAHIAGNRLVWS